MAHQTKKENKYTQTDYKLVSYSPEEEEYIPYLDGCTKIRLNNYKDPFLQDYYFSHSKWKEDGERFLKDEFVNEFIQTGKIPVLNDGRPEMKQFFDYTVSSNIFYHEWGETRRFAKTFMENMLKVYKEHGNIPEYVSCMSQAVIQLSKWTFYNFIDN